MTEFDVFGVQIEAICLFAVKRVACDGAAQTLRMGGVYTQLMRAPSQRKEVHAYLFLRNLQYSVVGDGRFAMLPADYLPRTV